MRAPLSWRPGRAAGPLTAGEHGVGVVVVVLQVVVPRPRRWVDHDGVASRGPHPGGGGAQRERERRGGGAGGVLAPLAPPQLAPVRRHQGSAAGVAKR
jgi:hypothetical protein